MAKKNITTSKKFKRVVKKIAFGAGVAAITAGGIRLTDNIHKNEKQRDDFEIGMRDASLKEIKGYMDQYVTYDSLEYAKDLAKAEANVNICKEYARRLEKRLDLEDEYNKAIFSLTDEYAEKVILEAKSLGGKPSQHEIRKAVGHIWYYSPLVGQEWLADKWDSCKETVKMTFDDLLPLCVVKDTKAMSKKLNSLSASFFKEFSNMQETVKRQNATTIEVLTAELNRANAELRSAELRLSEVREDYIKNMRKLDNLKSNTAKEYDKLREKPQNLRETKEMWKAKVKEKVENRS